MARVGPHVNRYHASGARPPLAAHIEAARREAKEAGGFEVGAAAVFVGGPHDMRITLSPPERAGLQAYARRTGLRLLAHSAYSAVPWRGNPAAAAFIREEADVCQAAGIEGLVVHLPKLPPAAVVKYLPRLLSPGAPGVVLYLENPATVPRETYYESPAKLAALFRALRGALTPAQWERVGLCVDTAHLWTSGVDLREYAGTDAWFRGLEAQAADVPLARVALHCNDSLRPRGVGPDAHAPLGGGQIWGEFAGRLARSGLAAALDFAGRHGAIVILERKPKEALRGDYLALRGLLGAQPPAGRRPAPARLPPGPGGAGPRADGGAEPAAPLVPPPPPDAALLDAFIEALIGPGEPEPPDDGLGGGASGASAPST